MQCEATPPPGFAFAGHGFCTGPPPQHIRPQYYECSDHKCPLFTAASCGKLCAATASCSGFMVEDETMYGRPNSCLVVSTAPPTGAADPSLWTVGRKGGGTAIAGHDTETRDCCYTKQGAPGPPGPPAPPPGTVTVTVDASGSASPSTPFKHVWKQSFGSGHAAVGLRDDWRSALQRAAAELGLRGVRQHGLLDDDIGVVVGHRTYNWSNVDN